MRSGVIIAGGRSTRFGDRDKAVADLAGVPMIRRVANRLVDVVDDLVVNCREDQIEAIQAALDDYPLEPDFAIDPEPDLGPMAGIRNGLGGVTTEYAFVVACDMPFVSPDLAAYLFDRVEGHDAAVPLTDDGWYQTTQAVYRARAMADACDRALEEGDSRIIDAILQLDYVEVTEDDFTEFASLRTFENINTAEELDAAASSF